MVSVFRSLFKGKFPEHTELEGALENLRGHGLKIIDRDTKGFSGSFDHFAESQASSVRPGLSQISEHGKEQVSSMKTLFTAASGLPLEIGSLKDMNLDMQKRLNEVHSAQNQAQKSKTEYEKANSALEMARARSNPGEIAKWEAKSDSAKFKAEQDERLAEEKQAGFEKYQQNYRFDFVHNLAASLSTAVDAKLKELSELSAIADKIISSAATIDDYEDGSIARHKKRLEDLEAELAQAQ